MSRFVTFEGGEGAGKTTQILLLAERLRSLGFDVVQTREPGGSPLAERLRTFILSPDRPSLSPSVEALLFAAARSDHLSKVVVPALEKGAFVLCDRFADSTMAYQGVSVGEDFLSELYRESVGVNGPFLTFVFDVEPEVGLARANVRRGKAVADRFESEGLDFHRALSERFLDIASRNSGRCVLVDCRNARSVNDIADDIFTTVAARFGIDLDDMVDRVEIG
jgi:dTMP kinase